jgi:hypothetical protein
VGVIQMQPNSAVVVGRVDPRRQPGTAFAEYGTTKQLGSRSAAISVNGGRQRVEIPLTGLTPQVRYWVRAVIQTAGGTVRGRRQSFVTPSLGAILVSPWPVPYGHAATLQGRIRGSGTAFARVALEGTPFPYTTPLVDLGAATQTDRLGNFTMQKVFRSNAQIRIRAEIPGSVVFGPQSKVRVRPIVRRRIRRISGRRVRISGTIRPPGAYRVSVRRGGRVIKRSRSRTRRGRTRYRLTFRVRRTGNYTVRAVRRDRSLVSYTTRAKRLRRR